MVVRVILRSERKQYLRAMKDLWLQQRSTDIVEILCSLWVAAKKHSWSVKRAEMLRRCAPQHDRFLDESAAHSAVGNSE